MIGPKFFSKFNLVACQGRFVVYDTNPRWKGSKPLASFTRCDTAVLASKTMKFLTSQLGDDVGVRMFLRMCEEGVFDPVNGQGKDIKTKTHLHGQQAQ